MTDIQIKYVVDPEWVQPIDCYCVVRGCVWQVAAECKWHGRDASPIRQQMHHPIKRVAQ